LASTGHRDAERTGSWRRLPRARPEPTGVVDRLLWRDAQQIINRHAEPDQDGNCVWCGQAWPCAPRRLAERADVASRRGWNEAWTVRNDLYGLLSMPGWRAELDSRTRGGWRRAGNNRGAFQDLPS
jgi:hypothetical protein